MSEKKEHNNDVFPREDSRGSGSTTAYSVEARTTYFSPQKLGEIILDDKWRTIPFAKAKEPIGVPNTLHCHHAEQAGLMTWPAANALRWWLHAGHDRFCLETRIVKHKVTWSYSIKTESAHHVISGEDRSSVMPDWNSGKKESAPTKSEDQTTKDYIERGV